MMVREATDRERETLRRLLVWAAGLVLSLFGWSVNRELAHISRATSATEMHVERLDERIGGMLLEQALLRGRLDVIDTRLQRVERDHNEDER